MDSFNSLPADQLAKIHEGLAAFGMTEQDLQILWICKVEPVDHPEEQDILLRWRSHRPWLIVPTTQISSQLGRVSEELNELRKLKPEN